MISLFRTVAPRPPIFSRLGKHAEFYLRNQAVGHGNPDDTGDKGRISEEEEVPVESSGLLEWKLSFLGRQATDVLYNTLYINRHSKKQGFACRTMGKKISIRRLTWS